jgi:hypothetical protein
MMPCGFGRRHPGVCEAGAAEYAGPALCGAYVAGASPPTLIEIAGEVCRDGPARRLLTYAQDRRRKE